MSAEIENPPAPNWLQKLEEQRERRLKAKLGHEADAGAKCQKCGDKCPGLDLHFWRKICKVCKCGKEDHDIVDDDVYGFVQFQLLGCKPKPVKGIFLKGRKDEVTLDWTPRGASTDVRSYLDELPADMLPVQGSEGARIRKQRLQKQMPPHDIDASLCHQLTEDEVKELEEYVSHIRKNCVGQGKIIRLSLLKGNKISPANPQYLSQVPPAQIASTQPVFLQSSDMANNLANLTLHDKNNPSSGVPNYAPQSLTPVVDNQNPVLGKMTDLNYFPQNIVHPLTTSNVERHQEQFEIENYANYAPNYLNPVEQNQIPVQVGQPKDIKYPQIDKLVNYNPNCVNTVDTNQIPTQIGQPKDIKYTNNVVGSTDNLNYPPINNATHPLLQNKLNYPTLHNVKGNLQEFNPNFINPKENLLLPSQIGQLKDLKYQTGTQNLDPINANQSYGSNLDPNNPNRLYGNQIGPNNPIYGTKIRSNDPNFIAVGQNLDPNNPNQVYGAKIGSNDPNDQNLLYGAKGGSNDPQYLSGNQNLDPNLLYGAKSGSNDPKYLSGGQNLDPNNPNNQICGAKSGSNDPNNPVNANYGQNLDNYQGDKLGFKPGIPILEAQNAFNPFETLQNLQSVGYIRDIDYPIENMENLDKVDNPKCHNCKEIFEDGNVAISVDRTSNLWHSKCFICHTCKQPLADLVYFYHKETDQIHCGRDYAILKGIPRCQACDELIFVREYCLAEDKTFHVKHFCCFECDEPLAGKQYILENDQPVCIGCYENLKAELCNDCNNKIKPDETGVSLQNLHWHANEYCFVCRKCRKALLGQKMLLRNQNLFCSDICYKSY